MICRGNQVMTASLAPGTVLGISEPDQISMFVLNDSPERPTTIGIGDFDEITVGSGPENNIVLKSRFISKRHFTIKRSGSVFYLTDRHSTNGTYVDSNQVSTVALEQPNIIVLGDAKIIFNGKALEVYYDSSLIQIQGINTARRDFRVPVIYKRSPRLKINVPAQIVEIENPPSIGGKPEINWLSTLLPVFSTAGIAVLLTAITGSFMMLVYSLPMTVVGLILSLTNHSRQKKKYAIQQNLRLEKYSEHLEHAVQTIENCQREQIKALEASDPGINTCLTIAGSLDSGLWQRRSVDGDFMSVRLGSGEVESSASIHYTKATLSLEEDELASKPQRIFNKYHMVLGAPITCDILKGQVCGIVGRHEDAVQLLNLVLVHRLPPITAILTLRQR